MRRLRVGILSTARIATAKVVPGLQRSDRVTVSAIASRDGDRARGAADRLGIERSYGDYEALLGADLDAVYVPLPNHLHAPWAIRAAEAGLHVLCEKPLAPTPRDARDLAAVCDRAGVVLAEGYMYRVHPQWTRAREVVASGVLGDVRTVDTVFAYHNTDPDDIRNIARFGGGALLDIGCYAIDVARWLFGAEPVDVVGTVERSARFGTDVLVSAVLAFPGGRQSRFTCGTQLAPQQRVTISGTRGHLTVEIPFNAPPDGPTRLLVAPTGTPAGPVDVVEVPAADQYALPGDAFAAAVLDGAPVPADAANGIADLEVIDALLR